MKTFSQFALAALVLLPQMTFASDHQRNIQILRSIPLFEGLEYRDESEERKITRNLQEIFEKIQGKAENADGSLNRATHAKGSCFEGEFTNFSEEVLKKRYGHSDALIKKLKVGIYSKNQTYKAMIRFGNGKGERNPDTTPDVRSMSFSLDLAGDFKSYSGESRQDFSANNTPLFAVNNIKEFYELMKTVSIFSGSPSHIPNPFYIRSTARAIKLIQKYERSDTKSYTTEHYWGNVPYTHGIENGIVKNVSKFRLVPCDGSEIQHESSEGKAGNYLQKDIELQVKKGKVCFLYQVQFLKANQKNKSLMIENGGSLWSEEEMPYYTVSKIEISRGSEKNLCKDWYLNPRLHSNPANTPIGSLSRVRAEVEEESRARRMRELSKR